MLWTRGAPDLVHAMVHGHGRLPGLGVALRRAARPRDHRRAGRVHRRDRCRRDRSSSRSRARRRSRCSRSRSARLSGGSTFVTRKQSSGRWSTPTVERRARLALVAFGYWHYGLVLGVVAVAAGLKKSIRHPYDHSARGSAWSSRSVSRSSSPARPASALRSGSGRPCTTDRCRLALATIPARHASGQPRPSSPR